MQQAIAQKQTQVGGDWFFWIAGFSVLSSVLTLLGTTYHSLFGLGTTQLIDAGFISINKEAAFGVDLFAVSFYVLYGFFARKGAQWAFIVGALFYLLDAALLLYLGRLLPIAFHAWALFRIFQGFQAARQLAVLRTQSAAFGNMGYVPPSSSPSRDVWPPPPSV